MYAQLGVLKGFAINVSQDRQCDVGCSQSTIMNAWHAPAVLGGVPTTLIPILLHKYRDTNGRRIVIQNNDVYATFGRHTFGWKSVPIEMGGLSLSLSKALVSGLDLTLLMFVLHFAAVGQNEAGKMSVRHCHHAARTATCCFVCRELSYTLPAQEHLSLRSTLRGVGHTPRLFQVRIRTQSQPSLPRCVRSSSASGYEPLSKHEGARRNTTQISSFESLLGLKLGHSEADLLSLLT